MTLTDDEQKKLMDELYIKGLEYKDILRKKYEAMGIDEESINALMKDYIDGINSDIDDKRFSTYATAITLGMKN